MCDPAKITIEGGYFDGEIWTQSGRGEQSGEVSIKSGTFTDDPKVFVPDADCYKVEQGENESIWTVTANHTWSGGEVTEEATYDKTGTKTYTCTVESCGATKTEEIPKLVRRSSGSSSSSTTTTTTDNVTNKTEDKGADTGSTTETNKVATTTATVKAETKTAADGTKTVAATVDTTTASKIVEKAVENKSEEVVVDTATAATVTETAEGTKTEVALPAETITQVAEKTEAAVTIKSDAAEAFP